MSAKGRPPFSAESLDIKVEPHGFCRRGWRFWICTACYAPKSLHPRESWVAARPHHDNRYLSASAPHFEGEF